MQFYAVFSIQWIWDDSEFSISIETRIKSVTNYFEDYWSQDNVQKQDSFKTRLYLKEALSYAFNLLKDHFGNLKNKKVLEIGPGKGYNLLEFVKMGCKITSIDISKKSLDISKKFLLKNKAFRNAKKLALIGSHNNRRLRVIPSQSKVNIRTPMGRLWSKSLNPHFHTSKNRSKLSPNTQLKC